MSKPETMKIGRQFRNAEIKSAGGDEYELTFSDETPVERFFGKEVLLHGPDNVRLGRINGGAAFLFNHNPSDPRGIVVPGSVSIGKDRRGHARVKFLPTDEGRKAKQMVDGGLRNTSVGYDIHAVRELPKGDGFECIDWEPTEISLAPVPAVTSVGFMRAAQGTEREVTVTRHSDSASAVRDASREPAARAATTKGVAMSDATTAAAAGNAEMPHVQMGADGTQVERLRITAINNLCRGNYGSYKPSEEDREKWINEGTTPDEVSRAILSQIQTRTQATQKDAPGALGLSDQEIKRYSITRAIRACTEKSWPKIAAFEAEVSQAIGRRMGKQAGEFNFYVPLEVQQAHGLSGQRDMIVATSTLGGYMVGTQVQGFIDLLRNRSVVMRLGATMLPGLTGSVSIPKQTAAATAYWFASEAGTATESTPTFGQLALTPKTVGGYVEVSRQLLLQTNYNADGIINADLARVIGLAVDTAAISGPGTAGQPTGITQTSGIGTANPTAGTAVVYADMIRFQSTVAGSNAMMPGFSYVTTPTVAGILMGKTRFTNSDTPIWEGNILDGRVVGAQAMTSLQIGSGQMLGGDFSNVVIGEWGVLEIEANPYAQFQSGIVGVRALYTCDVGVRYAAAFALGTGLTG
jgi:HK97 family phage major capsid protein